MAFFRALPYLLVFAVLVSPEFAISKPIQRQGYIEMHITDDFENRHSEVFTMLRDKLSGKLLELNFPTGKGPKWLRSGAEVEVQGDLKNGKLVVRDIAALNGESSQTSVQELEAAVTTNMKPLLIMVSDGKHDPFISDSTALNYMYGSSSSVEGLFEQNSRGLLDVNGDANADGANDLVHARIQSDVSASCAYTTWDYEARQDLAAQGVDLSIYTHHIYVLPAESGCSWAGLAYVDGTKSYARKGGDFVFAHELGHNLGLWHASTDRDNDGKISAYDEYADYSCFMGNASDGLRLANGVHASELGWVQVTDIQPGTHRVYSLETDPSQVGGMQVARFITSNNIMYYFTIRDAQSYAVNLPSEFSTGLNVHRYYAGSDTNSRFITSLAAGETFTHTSAGLEVVVTSVGPGYVDFTVNESTECTSGLLKAYLDRDTIVYDGSSTMSVSMTVENNDAGPCESALIELRSSSSENVSVSFGDRNFSVQSGLTKTVKVNLNLSAPLTQGETIQLSAYDIRHDRSATTSLGIILDLEAPTAPVLLSAEKQKKDDIHLSWQASSDNVGVNSYEIYRDTGSGFQKVGEVTGWSTGGVDYNGDSSYRYYIIAKDLAGNQSSPSNILSPSKGGETGGGGNDKTNKGKGPNK